MTTKPQRTKLYISIILIATILLSGCIGPGKDNATALVLSTTTPIPCTDEQISAQTDEFLILAPKTLYSGGESSVTMAAFEENQSVRRCIEYTLTDENNNDLALLKLSLIHISEPTRLGMISYAVFCLKKKKKK